MNFTICFSNFPQEGNNLLSHLLVVAVFAVLCEFPQTDASERQVPLHSELVTRLAYIPDRGPLFPGLIVSKVTKTITKLRNELSLERLQLVFHSTRKWFITQCEGTGVPEHFTASLVGHKSARSENKLTYGVHSAGIYDEQKRSIVDQIRLPSRCSG